MDPRPIAFFLPGLHAGGAERVTVNLARGMAQRRYPVDMVLAAAEGPFLDQLDPTVRLVDLAASRVRRSLLPLASYLRRERPRVLISSMSHANLIALWAARLAGQATPVVVTVHTSHTKAARAGAARRMLRPRLMRMFYPWASRVIAVSGGAADDLARATGVPRDRVEVIYNPVITDATYELARQDPGEPWLAEGQPPVMLGAGRLTAAKDFPNLIRAFALVRARRHVRLIILGEGEERGPLEALVRELGITDDVSLPGYHPNALACMARSSLFVLSSAWEGLPTVLIEALAVGAPVVSTDCRSGPREILQGGRLGTLVPVGDSEALANAMVATLDSSRAAAPASALEPFTMDAAVSHYLQVIDSVSSRDGRR
jgi:glycosyltransferase involved in cell wall biosynthesis